MFLLNSMIGTMMLIGLIVIFVMLILLIYTKNHSKRIQKLISINTRYKQKVQKYLNQPYYEYQFDTKFKYDSVNARHTVIKDYIKKYQSDLEAILDAIKCNENLKIDYEHEVNRLHLIDQMQILFPFESWLLKFKKISIPTDFSLTFKFKYVSPQGKNRYAEKALCDQSDIEAILNHISHSRKVEQLKKKERAKVTPKLRYDILKRDDFTCVLCGATNDHGAVLHVDHIYPISKGGKTELNNLRTLCMTCNIGKGAQIE